VPQNTNPVQYLYIDSHDILAHMNNWLSRWVGSRPPKEKGAPLTAGKIPVQGGHIAVVWRHRILCGDALLGLEV